MKQTKQLFRPRPIASESEEQQALFRWKRFNLGAMPSLKLLHKITNEGKRSVSEGARFVREGLKAGMPDVHLPVARRGYHSLYIELKAGDNKPSALQKECIEDLRAEGNCVCVCYGWVEAAAIITDYLKGGKP